MIRFCRRSLFATVTNAVIVGLSLIATGPIHAQSDQSASTRSLEGAWWVTVTLYDCTTGAKRPPFTSMLLFSRGGTLSETTANPGFLPGQRSTGFGTWAQAEGGTYVASDTAFIEFTGGTFQQGTQRLAHSITLGDADHFSDQAVVQFFNASGTLIMQGCASASAARLR